MKNYCDKCNVEIEKTAIYCPLCGRCVNEHLINKKVSNQNFPSDEKIIEQKKKALSELIRLIILLNCFSIIVNFFTAGAITWSLHVIVGSLFAFIGIILPINNNWNLINYHSTFYIAFTLYIIFLENYTNSFGWGIVYVVPLFALALSFYNFYMVLSDLNTRTEYILPMLILIIISTISLIYNYTSKLVIWPSLAAFLVIVFFTSLLFIFRSTKIGKALLKKLYI